MPRRRGDWDDDFYAGEPRPPRRDDGPEFRPPRRGYEYDERDVPRAGRPPELRGDYDDRASGRGDYYRDEYYTGRRPDPRDLSAEQEYERGRVYDGRGYEREPRRGHRRGATRSHLRCRDIMTRDVT